MCNTALRQMPVNPCRLFAAKMPVTVGVCVVQIKGGPLLQKQLVHNATIANIVPRWHTFQASQFDLQVQLTGQKLHFNHQCC